MFIQLIGEVRLYDAEGNNCTPRSSKARAIIALLARTPGARRPRSFLENCLWSDRGHDQAAGSLRQALSEIRKSLGENADWLRADRQTASLGPHEIDLERHPVEALRAMQSGRLFLEDLRITDPAFCAWLTAERQRLHGQNLGDIATQTAPAQPQNVPSSDNRSRPLILRVADADGPSGFSSTVIADAIANLMTDFTDLDIYLDAPEANGARDLNGALSLDIRTAPLPDSTQLLARLSTPDTGRLLWSRSMQVEMSDLGSPSSGKLPALIYEAAEIMLTGSTRSGGGGYLRNRVDGLITRAVNSMFTYDAAELRVAEALLSEADKLMPDPRIAAWRSMVRQIMIVERTEPDRERLTVEAEVFVAHAMQTCKGNALVMGLVAQLAMMLRGDVTAAEVLARDAVTASPHNAFSHGAHATVALRAGQAQAALAASLRAVGLAQHSPYIHWFNSIVGLAAIALRDYSLAIRYYERAHARAPKFRSAIRHLLCLYITIGNAEGAHRMAEKLAVLEPDFEVERLSDDFDYPVHTLRKMKLTPPPSLSI